MQEMQAALEQRKRSGVGKKRWHLHQERDQGLERDVGTSAKKEIIGAQQMQALEPGKRSEGCKTCRHLNQKRNQGVAKMQALGPKKKIRGLQEM